MKMNSMFIVNQFIKGVLGNDKNSINYVAITTHLNYEWSSILLVWTIVIIAVNNLYISIDDDYIIF